MTKILILYYSYHGTTMKLALDIAQGVVNQNAETMIRTVPEVTPATEKTQPDVPDEGAIYVTKEDLEQCDGIILGSPTRFGNMASPLKYFMDTTSDLWFKGTMINKPAGVFTSTASLHGGQETTLLTMMMPLIHHGAIIAGLPYDQPDLNETQAGGTPYGPSHHSNGQQLMTLTKEESELAKALGRRIAALAQKMKQ